MGVRLIRVRPAEWLAGAAGVVLIVSVFLGWVSTALGVILVLLALVGVALLVAQAARPSPALPTALSVLTVLAGLVATIIVAVRLIADGEGGAWLGLAGALGLLVAGWWSVATEPVRGMPLPEVRARPAPPPGG
jgi:hypothetical protein